MAMQDPATIIDEILGEADALITPALDESGLEVMHVTLAITQNGMGVVRTNVGRSFSAMGEELVDLSSRIEPPDQGAKH